MRSVTRVAPSRPCVRASASRLRVCLRSQSGPAKPLLRRHYSTEVPQQGEPAPQQAEAAPPVPEGPSLRLPLTKLRGTREDLMQKIKGMFYGAAIGDAIGRTVEGERSDVTDGLPPVLLPPGSWTSETEQLLVLTDSLVGVNDLSIKDFASRLHQWSTAGLPGAPRPLPASISDANLEKLLQNPSFASAPAATARQAWDDAGRPATTGALVRSAALGAVDMFDTPSIVKNSKSVCLVTHPDPRCVASSVLLSSFIGALLRGGIRLGAPTIELRPVLQLSVGLGIQELETEKQIRELQQVIRASSLKDLKLTEDPSNVYKALGAGIFSILNFKTFEEGISRVALSGGNTVTNTAVAGALMGVHYGEISLPDNWVDALSRRAEIEQRVNAYMTALGL